MVNSLSPGTFSTWNGLAQKLTVKILFTCKEARMRNDITYNALKCAFYVPT